jgi:predicted enzyme related to lactoylglutathione lyase
MTQRDSYPVGAPCWVDLFTSDPDRSRAFYAELFGWASTEAGAEYGGYVNFTKDGRQVAGCMKNNGEAPVDLWSVYLTSDDARKTTEVAAANGGTVVVPAMAVGELGSMAVLTDAGQATIGVWQPGLHQGFGVVEEHDTPRWFELHTRDYDAAVAFYKDVFGWDAHVASDEPGFRYTTLGEGDSAAAGIMDASAFLPEGVPAHWSVYFDVADVDAALDKVVALGGAVIAPAEDTPYGRLATAADSTGAVFKLMAT